MKLWLQSAALVGILMCILIVNTCMHIPIQNAEAGPILTNLEQLELSLLPPDPPMLECEMLTGDERYFPRDPRPQFACYSNKRGNFFISFDYEGQWVAFENTNIPSLAYGNIFSTAALLQVVFMASDGSIATTEFLVENDLYSLHCVQPLCMRI